MEGILFVAVLALGAACWWLWEERTKYRQEVERLKSAFTNLQSEFRGKDSALVSLQKDFGQYQDSTTTALSVVTTELHRVADMFLPPVENVKELLLRMSADDIAKANLPFSAEFTHTLAQLGAQKGEAITLLNEAGLRLSLGVKYLMMVGTLNPHSVEYMGQHLQLMQRVMQAQAPLVNVPGFREWFIADFATAMNRLMKASLNGDEPPSAEHIALWTKAFEASLALAEASDNTDPEAAEEKSEPAQTTFSRNGKHEGVTVNE